MCVKPGYFLKRDEHLRVMRENFIGTNIKEFVKTVSDEEGTVSNCTSSI